ncbi:MAG: DUF6434 domain-containing protein [Pseudomonadota bacterium]
MTAQEFGIWYWPVSLLREICEGLNIPAAGNKADLRKRIEFALDNPNAALPKVEKHGPRSRFKWSSEELSRDSIITDNVSFGPNVRNFFKREIGKRFVCHSDFMDWVKTNVGATLGDAILAWQALEDRKLDPTFRREIAECNNYLQYLRDIRDANTALTVADAKTCWDEKKIRPTIDGIVRYEKEDLRFLDRN